MTQDEALTLVAALRAGKTFATRHQEDEWGLRVRKDGRFDKWSHRLLIEGGEEHATDVLDEGELVALLVKWYGFDRIKAGLR